MQTLTLTDWAELAKKVQSHEDYTTFVEHLKANKVSESDFEALKLIALQTLNQKLNK